MARYWNLRRNIDRISLDILDLIDVIKRDLRNEHFVYEAFHAEVISEMASVDILENLNKCEITINLMEDTNRVLKLEARRRELYQSVSFMYNTFVLYKICIMESNLFKHF